MPEILRDLKNKSQIEPLIYKGTEAGGYYDVIPSPNTGTRPTGAGRFRRSLTEQPTTRGGAATREIAKREADLRVTKIPGYFPTPAAVADRMVDLADIQPAQMILEPNGGKGSLIDAIQRKHPDAAVDVYEVNHHLRELLCSRARPFGHDFWRKRPASRPGYDRILMNPPFEKGQDIEHVTPGLDSLLKPGGRLVAIVSAGAMSRGDKKARRLPAASWTTTATPTRRFPAGTFTKEAGPTWPRALVLDKPEGTAARGRTWPELVKVDAVLVGKGRELPHPPPDRPRRPVAGRGGAERRAATARSWSRTTTRARASSGSSRPEPDPDNIDRVMLTAERELYRAGAARLGDMDVKIITVPGLTGIYQVESSRPAIASSTRPTSRRWTRPSIEPWRSCASTAPSNWPPRRATRPASCSTRSWPPAAPRRSTRCWPTSRCRSWKPC